jgi:hypothetical protein
MLFLIISKIIPLQSSQEHHARNDLDEVLQPHSTNFHQHLGNVATKKNSHQN